jgi:hypothetical protein
VLKHFNIFVISGLAEIGTLEEALFKLSAKHQ